MKTERRLSMKKSELIKLYHRKFNFRNTTSLLFSLFRAFLLIGLCFVIVYPLIMKISTSFKSVTDFYDTTIILFPKNPTLEFYKKVIQVINYGATLINTFAFSTISALLQTISCTLIAYGIARFKFPGKNILFGFVLATLLIPAQTILLPLYLQFKSFSFASLFSIIPPDGGVRLLDTVVPFYALSITGLAFRNGLFIFMLRQYYINMPYVLEEAAYIDGCNEFKTFTRIMLPGSVSMMITIFLFAFVWQWNDNYYTTFFATDLPVMAVQLMNLQTRVIDKVAGGMAGGWLRPAAYTSCGVILQAIPLLLVYSFGQKFFVESVETSGIVG